MSQTWKKIPRDERGKWTNLTVEQVAPGTTFAPAPAWAEDWLQSKRRPLMNRYTGPETKEVVEWNRRTYESGPSHKFEAAQDPYELDEDPHGTQEAIRALYPGVYGRIARRDRSPTRK